MTWYDNYGYNFNNNINNSINQIEQSTMIMTGLKGKNKEINNKSFIYDLKYKECK